MKILRYILLGVGVLLLAFQVLMIISVIFAHQETLDPEEIEAANSFAGKAGYYTGLTFFAILGIIFIWVSVRIKRRMNRKLQEKIVNEFGNIS